MLFQLDICAGERDAVMGSNLPGADAPAAGAPSPVPRTPSTPQPTPTLHRHRHLGSIVAIGIVVVIVAATVGVGFQQHWFGGSSSGGGGCSNQELQGNGAQFVLPLMTQWISSYAGQTGNRVNYPAAGSGAGITDLEETTVDFAVTDDPLSASEAAAMPGTVLTLPMTGSALAIIYNVPGVSGHLNLSGAVIADIYLGKITHWNDPAIAANNTGVPLPSDPIQTVHRSDAAGTTFVLTDLLSQDSATWNHTVGKGISISWPTTPEEEAIKGNSNLLSYVQTTSDTIGYSDLTDVLISSTPVGYAAVQNPSGGWVVPTLANTASAISDLSNETTFPAASETSAWYQISMVNAPGAGDYPLATFAYIFVFQNASQGFAPTLVKTQVLLQWLGWILTVGQSQSSGPNLYYVPLPHALVLNDQAGIQTITYGGGSVPACT